MDKLVIFVFIFEFVINQKLAQIFLSSDMIKVYHTFQDNALTKNDMSNKNHLPYFKIKNTPETNQIARFLLRKISPPLKKKCPLHYLISGHPNHTLKYIHNQSQKYFYFLKIDIEKYFPSINHKILLETLPKTIQKITKKNISRQTQKYLQTNLPEFLSQSPLGNKGLPLGNYLGYILSGIYLLSLDLDTENPFLRMQDDYLFFGKTQKELELLLRGKIIPHFSSLDLSLNARKTKTGRFHRDRIAYLGYSYSGGYFSITREKIENFKRKIIALTHLTKKNSIESTIKKINYQTKGFGHYYKFTSCKSTFANLDSFIRSRIRRYITRTKNSDEKFSNILLTNDELRNFGLLSLSDIYEKYTAKNRHKIRKTIKKKAIEGRNLATGQLASVTENMHRIQLNSLLKEMEKLAKEVKKVNSRLGKMEKKLDR